MQADRGVCPVGVIDDFLEAVMGNDVEPINCRHAGAFAIGQAQTSANGLLDQGAGIGGTQRDYGVEVGYVPAFFEHVDMDDDLGWLLHAFHAQQTADHFLFVLAGLAGVHLNHLAGIAPVEQLVLQAVQQLRGMTSVSGDNQHEGLDQFDCIFPGVGE
ncbi:hypothetical protein D3C84_600190 [compost metagenome]